MSLETIYDLLAPVPDVTSDRTIPGRERFSGRPVTIHLLGGSVEANRELLARADRLPERERLHIFETGAYIGIACAITDELPGGQSFRAWVAGVAAEETVEMPGVPANPPGEFTLFLKQDVGQAGAGMTAAPGVSKSEPPPAQKQEPGEFTMFLRGAAGRESPPPSPGPRTEGSSVAERQSPQPAPQAGEFTMFVKAVREGEPSSSDAPAQAPAVPPKRDYTVPERPVRPQPASQPQQSDIETKIFSAPVAPKSADAPPPARPSTDAEGEFTRFLKGSEPARDVSPPRNETFSNAQSSAATENGPFPAASSAPGEFTQWLRGPQAGTAGQPKTPPLAGAAHEQTSGEYTKIISGQSQAASGGGSMFAPPPPPVGNPLPRSRGVESPSPAGSDDFDRVIGSGTPQSGNVFAAAPVGDAPAPAGGRNRERLIIIAAIVVVVLLVGLAIAAVLLI